jgi:hypothetical protein
VLLGPVRTSKFAFVVRSEEGFDTRCACSKQPERYRGDSRSRSLHTYHNAIQPLPDLFPVRKLDRSWIDQRARAAPRNDGRGWHDANVWHQCARVGCFDEGETDANLGLATVLYWWCRVLCCRGTGVAVNGYGRRNIRPPQAAPTVPRQRNTQTPPIRLDSYDRRYAGQRLHIHSTVCHLLVQGLTPFKSESMPVRVSLPASEQISQSTAMEKTSAEH